MEKTADDANWNSEKLDNDKKRKIITGSDIHYSRNSLCWIMRKGDVKQVFKYEPHRL